MMVMMMTMMDARDDVRARDVTPCAMLKHFDHRLERFTVETGVPAKDAVQVYSAEDAKNSTGLAPRRRTLLSIERL